MVQICPLAFSCSVFLSCPFLSLFFFLWSQLPGIGKPWISLSPYPTLICIYWVSHYYPLSFNPEFSSCVRMGRSTRFLGVCSLFLLNLPEIYELISNPACQDDRLQWLTCATSRAVPPLRLLHFPALARVNVASLSILGSLWGTGGT